MSVPDWILQQTLAVQNKAHTDWLKTKPELKPDDGGLTLTVLGCGTMGIAILNGILEANRSNNSSTAVSSSISGSYASDVVQPDRLPTKFNACVRSASSAKKVTESLQRYDANLSVYQNRNVETVQDSDIIFLCCEPHAVGDILRETGMAEALAGKILVSIIGGFSQENLEDTIYGSFVADIRKCTIVRAMPNTAAAVQQSMTVIASSTPPLSEETDTLITWIFSQIGKVVHVPAPKMDACTALCSSGPAFVALMAESMAAGAIAMGVSREDAYMMAAQAMRGTSDMLLQGEHPALLRDKISTPGGCTIAGLNILEEGAIRGTIAKAIRESTKKLTQDGQQDK